MKAREIVCFSPQTGFQIVKLILVKHPEMQHFPGFPGQAGVRRERMPILKYQQKFEFLKPDSHDRYFNTGSVLLPFCTQPGTST